MRSYGQLKEFAEGEVWIEYVERMEMYFTANDIDDGGKKRAIFLSTAGPKVYGLIRNLLSPAKPNSKSFDELTKLVTDHMNPTPSIIVERFKFNTSCRKEGESMSNFGAELRKMAEPCKFPAEILDDMLRDRLVVDCIKNDSVQRRLLAEAQLTYAKALEIAVSMEMAAKNAREVQRENGSVHKMEKSDSFKGNDRCDDRKSTDYPRKPCWRCGGKHKTRTVDS